MKRLIKLMAGALLVLVALGGLALGVIATFFPRVPVDPAMKVEATPEALARGKYLVDHVAVCLACHSGRDWKHHAAPIVPGTEGQGGERFGPEGGLPGTFHAANITPAALSGWSDGELARAIASGVSRDGTALFPIMPYKSYAQMTAADLAATIAHLRTLEPLENPVSPRQMKFPMSIIVNMIPAAYQPSAAPDPRDRVARGRYLVTLGACADCHTPRSHGKPVPGRDLAGGFALPMPSGETSMSANITPDATTGIGAWSEEMFVTRFKAHEGEAGRAMPVPAGKKNTVMPWNAYAGMTREDLGAIHAYLKTVPPVVNRVEN